MTFIEQDVPFLEKKAFALRGGERHFQDIVRVDKPIEDIRHSEVFGKRPLMMRRTLSSTNDLTSYADWDHVPIMWNHPYCGFLVAGLHFHDVPVLLRYQSHESGDFRFVNRVTIWNQGNWSADC